MVMRERRLQSLEQRYQLRDSGHRCHVARLYVLGDGPPDDLDARFAEWLQDSRCDGWHGRSPRLVRWDAAGFRDYTGDDGS
jgi:hypothetical protein